MSDVNYIWYVNTRRHYDKWPQNNSDLSMSDFHSTVMLSIHACCPRRKIRSDWRLRYVKTFHHTGCQSQKPTICLQTVIYDWYYCSSLTNCIITSLVAVTVQTCWVRNERKIATVVPVGDIWSSALVTVATASAADAECWRGGCDTCAVAVPTAATINHNLQQNWINALDQSTMILLGRQRQRWCIKYDQHHYHHHRHHHRHQRHHHHRHHHH